MKYGIYTVDMTSGTITKEDGTVIIRPSMFGFDNEAKNFSAACMACSAFMLAFNEGKKVN